MTEVEQKRAAEKKKIEDYKARALALFGGGNCKLNPYEPVALCEGGAFVGMVVWVSDPPENK